MADAGSALGAAGTGAATGAMVGGPWGAAIGGAIGLGSSLLGGLFGVGATQREPGRYEVDPNAYQFVGGNVAGAQGYQGAQLSRTDQQRYASAQEMIRRAQAARQQIIHDYANHMGLDPSQVEHWSDADKQQIHAMEGAALGGQSVDDIRNRAQSAIDEINQKQQAFGQQNYVGSIDYSANQAMDRLGGLQAQAMQQGQAAQDRGAYDINQAYAPNEAGLRQTDALLYNAATGQTPSVAQLQAQQQMQQANLNALGLMNSTSNPAARALAARTAIQGFGQNAATSAQQQAMIRAQEMEAARGRLADYRSGLATTQAGQALQSNLQQRQLNDEMLRQMYGYGLSAAELQERARQAGINQGMQARGMLQGAQQARQELQNAAYQGQAGLSYQTGVQKAQAGANMFAGGVGAVQSGLQYGALAMNQGNKGGG